MLADTDQVPCKMRQGSWEFRYCGFKVATGLLSFRGTLCPLPLNLRYLFLRSVLTMKGRGSVSVRIQALLGHLAR